MSVQELATLLAACGGGAIALEVIRWVSAGRQRRRAIDADLDAARAARHQAEDDLATAKAEITRLTAALEIERAKNGESND